MPASVPHVTPTHGRQFATLRCGRSSAGAPPLAGMDQLIEAVQTNCHIADATQATESSLCIYLLQMREFFRWERGAKPLQNLPRDELGAWLAKRETLWATLEGRSFEPIPLFGREHDPFDTDTINALLRPHGLAYGAGQLSPGRVSFFLAELEIEQRRGGVEVRVCGCEHARGLSAPPAVLAQSTVLLRRESLLRWLGEKYEAWAMKHQQGPFESALRAHGFCSDTAGTGSADGFAGDAIEVLRRMAACETETLILHELGEHAAGQRLGEEWSALRAGMDSRRADLHLRALRDHLADCLVTLPTLLKNGPDASLHFWFSNLEGVRAALFGRLNRAYSAWCAGDGGVALNDCIEAGAAHWQNLSLALCDLHLAGGPDARAQMEALLYADSTRLD